MSEWLYEAGIGEDRAALIEHGEIAVARIAVHDPGLRLGAVLGATLVEGGRLARVALDCGGEAMLSPIPPGLTVGRHLTVEIVREAIPEHRRPKLPKAVPTDAPAKPGPDLLAEITATGVPVRRIRPHEPDALESAGWSELLEESATGEIAFPGGALRMAVTPAMTLFDVDGDGDPARLAIAAAGAVARAIRRMGIGGSIGVDFPTLANKAERGAVAEAFDAAMIAPFERTAVNGYGFLQVIRPRARASLPELLASDPAAAEARALLRRIERTPPPGVAVERVSLSALAALKPEWIAELHRRTGTATRFEAS
ncbi:ribonuclease [Sphingomonas gilva]|uniref:Ribonuclease n=1 Tax=Sphingomonas gilva TaxID=2305907 RepID=A0A396RSQ0_9SPHN|nr:ribonuclease [Sphingomonas gilva]RHW18402.1 ribonuclease [Sphingomonas gilva]